MDVRFKYLSQEFSRHGRALLYVRRKGRRVRIHAKPGTAAFAQEYAAALERGPVESIKAPTHGTFGWLAARYFVSIEFCALDPVTQRRRRSSIEDCLCELHKGALMRDCPLAMLTPAKIKAMRDAKGSKRGAANNRLKFLSALFGWAIESGLMQTNPCRDVRRLKYSTEGFHPWTFEEVRQFEERHLIGTKARLAFAMLMFLGVRRGDVVTLGPKHIQDDVLSFVPRKTRHRRVVISHKPILPELATIIAASPIGRETFLETSFGKQFTAAGFGNWFRERCNEAGLPACSAHGLRKTGATVAAERGATVHELMAIFDWATPAQAEPYTRGADRKRLAAGAMAKLTPRNG